MKLRNSRIGVLLTLVLGMLACGVASATPVMMNFDGLVPGSKVHNYYDGGCTTWNIFFQRSCGGPDYGVRWQGAHVRSVFDEPSAPNWAGPGLFSDGTMTMNVADGFDTGLYFYYTTFLDAFSGTMTVYSGQDGQGTELGHLDLSGTDFYCNGDIPCWLQTGLDFTGHAKSVTFDGFGAAFGLDDVTIGASMVAVPEPAALGIFGLGLLLVGAFVGLRRRTS
ncbi:MAG TPA: PEP-CTERM sorting domain-containing protein [Rhodanobacteraceae bacterium]|nr:PEP-CTERM sorting domain-containing protein [Rhodanobacteraceae bacterium]